MWAQVTVALDPPLLSGAKKLCFPVLPSQLRDHLEETYRLVADYCFREYGPGTLTGDLENGLTFRFD